MDENIQRCLMSMSTVLDGMQQRADATLKYCMLSDSVYWSDEIPSDDVRWQTELSRALRYILRYRTTLILENPDEAYREVFEAGRQLFPNWPGYLPGRAGPSPVVRKFFEDARANAISTFPDIE